MKTPSRELITSRGRFIRTAYGVCKAFEWRLYEYKGQRYDVPMFEGEEVRHIGRTYCDLCGKATYSKSCCGQSLRALQA